MSEIKAGDKVQLSAFGRDWLSKTVLHTPLPLAEETYIVEKYRSPMVSECVVYCNDMAYSLRLFEKAFEIEELYV